MDQNNTPFLCRIITINYNYHYLPYLGWEGREAGEVCQLGAVAEVQQQVGEVGAALDQSEVSIVAS